jgi:hypothetical protein
MTEASVGLTFSAIALGAENDVCKADRNTDNARAAYDAILRFRPRLVLSNSECAKLDGLVTQLRANLLKLGEDV